MTFTDFEICKLLSFDIAQKVVCEQKLRFNKPSFFNDPFDCDIELIRFDHQNISSGVAFFGLASSDRRQLSQAFLAGAHSLQSAARERLSRGESPFAP